MRRRSEDSQVLRADLRGRGGAEEEEASFFFGFLEVFCPGLFFCFEAASVEATASERRAMRREDSDFSARGDGLGLFLSAPSMAARKTDELEGTKAFFERRTRIRPGRGDRLARARLSQPFHMGRPLRAGPVSSS